MIKYIEETETEERIVTGLGTTGKKGKGSVINTSGINNALFKQGV